MSDVAISVEDLGKKFIIGHKKESDFRNAFGSKLKRLLKPGHGHKEEFWALKDVNFQIKKGEAIGIIGRNGAGKSTLLKILSRITEPTTGRFEINGRVSSLLEVGTGFHMELTGRENIYLNGTILGMRRSEIKNKFDEIIEFSGVEKFIDTPVKHYSSGMKVRLAFSVAAHLEPEILIVDEVLAVGDAEFQKKCLGKMNEVSRKKGRTVLFVSHNLASVSQLCDQGLQLRQGKVIYTGEITDVIHNYVTYNLNIANSGELNNLDLRKGNGRYRVDKILLLDKTSTPVNVAVTGSEAIFELTFNSSIDPKHSNFRIDFAIDNELDVRVAWFSSAVIKNKLEEKFKKIYLRIPRYQFGSGIYHLTFFITCNGEVVDYIHQGYSFQVEEGDFFGTGKIIPKSQTFIYTDHNIFSD